MGAETIIGHKRAEYHHLDDIKVTEIVTKVNLLGPSGRTEGMRRIAKEEGCSLDTVYRIYRTSRVDIEAFDYRRCEYVLDHTEHCSAAAIHRRAVNRVKSLSNASKMGRCNSFVRSCLSYIRGSRIRTIDEAVHVIGKDYTGTTCCTKTFYNWVNAGKVEGLARIDLPRAPGWKSKPKSFKTYTPEDSRGKSVIDRPEEINERKEFGHWEGDLVVGPKDGVNGAYITLIERVTRFYLMLQIKDKKSSSVLDALRAYKESHPLFSKVFKSITFDNGSEFALWRDMEKYLGIETYFGRPYHSCDRGSNENCNGLIRRFIPKGTDINTIGREETRRINMEINGKRRKLLGYESAADCFISALMKQGIPYSSMY